MEEASEVPAAWSLCGLIGQLQRGPFGGTIDVSRPDLGLQDVMIRHELIRGSYLNVIRGMPASNPISDRGDSTSWRSPVADAYVRGNDLVASYQSIDEWPYSPQLYWQADLPGSVGGVAASLSLLVSLQTQLLDTRPQISVVSRAPTAELMQIAMNEGGKASVKPIGSEECWYPTGASCCVIRRLPNTSFSYIEVIASSDFCEATVSSNDDGTASVTWHLFSEFLEKGVIRRARVNAALLPAEKDIELAIECCAAIEHFPLPLTA